MNTFTWSHDNFYDDLAFSNLHFQTSMSSQVTLNLEVNHGYIACSWNLLKSASIFWDGQAALSDMEKTWNIFCS